MTKLATYLDRENISEAAFGAKIGVSQAAVNRYKNGRVPEPPVMRQILVATSGEVTPNDWYDIPAATEPANTEAAA